MTAELPKLAEHAEKICIQIKPSDKDQYLKDSHVKGLMLRVTPNSKTSPGRKYWQLRYHIKIGEKHVARKISIGPYREGRHGTGYTVREARNLAEKMRAETKHQHKDHLAEKRIAAQNRAEDETRQRIEEQNTLTMKDLLTRWKNTYLKYNRKDKGEEVFRIINTKIIEKYGNLNVKCFGKKEFMIIVDKELAKGNKRMANVILSLTKQMLNFATLREIIDKNPISELTKNDVGGRDNERKRVLCEADAKDDELPDLFDRIERSSLIESTRIAILIMLTTCCRVGEIARAEWKHLDFEKKTWLIPEVNNKSDRDFSVQLSDFTIKLFEKLKLISGECDWVYPNRKLNKSTEAKNLSKQVGDRQPSQRINRKGRVENDVELILPGGRWTVHDLRRTGATLMGQLGVASDIIERCLNHEDESKLKRIYQRYDYVKEMRAAWNLLGSYVEKMEKK